MQYHPLPALNSTFQQQVGQKETHHSTNTDDQQGGEGKHVRGWRECKGKEDHMVYYALVTLPAQRAAAPSDLQLTQTAVAQATNTASPSPTLSATPSPTRTNPSPR